LIRHEACRDVGRIFITHLSELKPRRPFFSERKEEARGFFVFFA